MEMQEFEEKIEIVRTSRNMPMMILHGYSYIIDRNRNDRTYWKCSRNDICKMRVTTDSNHSRIINGPMKKIHEHDMPDIEKYKTFSDIKDMAKIQKFAKPSQIVHKVYGETEKISLPSRENAAQVAKRVRRKLKIVEPNDINEVDFTETKLLNGENFCLFDNRNEHIVEIFGHKENVSQCENDDRLVIFGTKENVARLMGCDEWMVDATFDIVPKMFYQLLTIMGKRYGRWFPLIYVLMSGKKEEEYKKVWEQLLLNAPDVDGVPPTSLILHTDLEKASINAFLFHFPDSTIQSCLFHLGQAVIRKVQKFGLFNRYINDQSFKVRVRMLVALAFLPMENVIDGFKEVSKFLEDVPDLTEYFDNTYVRGAIIRKSGETVIRRRPNFLPQQWNVSSGIESGMDRTNNVIEGHHNAMRIIADRCHVGINELIKVLMDKQHVIEKDMLNHLSQGAIPKKKAKTVRDRESAIINLKKLFDEKKMPVVDYLHGIAMNVPMK